MDEHEVKLIKEPPRKRLFQNRGAVAFDMEIWLGVQLLNRARQALNVPRGEKYVQIGLVTFTAASEGGTTLVDVDNTPPARKLQIESEVSLISAGTERTFLKHAPYIRFIRATV